MKRVPAWRRYLRFFGPDPAADVDDELQFHLQTKIEELIAAGHSSADARAEALRQFGPVRPVRRECTRISHQFHARASRAEYLAGWLRDVRYAVRSLSRARLSTTLAILILALGIGGSTAIFTLLDRLLLAPLPVPHPSQLLLLSATTFEQAKGIQRNFTPQAYRNLRDHNQAFSGVAAEASVAVREQRTQEHTQHPADAVAVSENYFQVLGVAAQSGRVFSAADRPHVAVVSYRFWTTRFQQAPDTLGRTLYLNQMPFTIIGVLPRGFFGLHRANDDDVYVPLGALPPTAGDMFRDHRWLRLFARLRPGVSLAAAQSSLRSFAAPGERIQCIDASTGTPGAGAEKRRSLWLLAGIVGVLLLMGCANVSCLLLARGTVRRQEMAIRLSLGAKRTRVLRQSLLESCLLSFAGGAAGLALAAVMERLLLAAFRWQELPIDLAPDTRVLTFGTALSLIAAILFGLAPALQLWRGGRLTLVSDRGNSPSFGPVQLVAVLEVALSLIMVAGAVVFLRSFQNLRAVPIGFSPDHVTFLELDSALNPGSLKAPYADATLLAESLRTAPGVQSAAVSDMLTFDDGSIQYGLTFPNNPTHPACTAHLLRIDGSYFDTLRIPLQTGRTFTPHDDLAAPRVAILSQTAARRLFGDRNPLGQRILLGLHPHPKPEDETEIVGVVNDIKFGTVTAPAPDTLFQPLLQGQNNAATTSTLKLHIRSTMTPSQVAALVNSRIRATRLAIHLTHAAPLEDAIAHSMLNDRIRMQASAIFGLLALLLITAGIYGLMAYSVAMRTREIGIRMAVGSQPGGIVAMVLRQALRITLGGVLLGLPGALLVMKAVSGLVFGLAPIDWASVAVAAVVLCLTGILAGAAPAWRAAHLDPVQALRVQ